MASFLNPCNDTGSPSLSRTDDNLSNSEGPLLKRSSGKNNLAVSSENVSGMKNVLSKYSSKASHRAESTSTSELTKKRYCLWALALILGIVGVCNLLLSIAVVAVLRVGHGMEAMEVIPEESLVKFYGTTDLDRVRVGQGVCQGYGDEPVELTGNDSGVLLTVKNSHRNNERANFRVLQNGSAFSLVESFEMKDSRTGNSVFSTNFPNFGLPSGVRKLAVNLAEAHRIVSPVNSSLSFESKRHVTIHGAESTRMESKTIVWVADNDIRLKSNYSIVLDTDRGIFLDAAKMPVAPVRRLLDEPEFPRFKVCICMPRGKLFRIPVPPDGNVRVNCAKISYALEHDPCQ